MAGRKSHQDVAKFLRDWLDLQMEDIRTAEGELSDEGLRRLIAAAIAEGLKFAGLID